MRIEWMPSSEEKLPTVQKEKEVEKEVKENELWHKWTSWTSQATNKYVKEAKRFLSSLYTGSCLLWDQHCFLCLSEILGNNKRQEEEEKKKTAWEVERRQLTVLPCFSPFVPRDRQTTKVLTGQNILSCMLTSSLSLSFSYTTSSDLFPLFLRWFLKWKKSLLCPQSFSGSNSSWLFSYHSREEKKRSSQSDREGKKKVNDIQRTDRSEGRDTSSMMTMSSTKTWKKKEKEEDNKRTEHSHKRNRRHDWNPLWKQRKKKE